jgi:hypothetical protein
VRRHKKEPVAAQATEPDPVDTFLAQAPFVEQEGVEEAAVARDELLRSGHDADAISETIRLMNLHHEQSR